MSTISKINGIAIASIAKVNGIAKTSISKIDGISMPSSGAPAPYSLYFLTASQKYIDLGTTVLDELGDLAFSINAWVKSPVSSTNTLQILGTEQSSTNRDGIIFVHAINPSGGMTSGNVLAYHNQDSNTWADGNWHMITFTYTPNGTDIDSANMHEYVDKTEHNSITNVTVALRTVKNNMNIGRREAATPDRYFTGYLANITKWPFVLSSSEINELYGSGGLAGAKYDVSTHSRWNDLKDSTRACWYNFGNSTYNTVITDLKTSHNYNGVPYNFAAEDLVAL